MWPDLTESISHLNYEMFSATAWSTWRLQTKCENSFWPQRVVRNISIWNRHCRMTTRGQALSLRMDAPSNKKPFDAWAKTWKYKVTTIFTASQQSVCIYISTHGPPMTRQNAYASVFTRSSGSGTCERCQQWPAKMHMPQFLHEVLARVVVELWIVKDFEIF